MLFSYFGIFNGAHEFEFAASPDELRALGSLKTFMARLKTHYFKLAFSL